MCVVLLSVAHCPSQYTAGHLSLHMHVLVTVCTMVHMSGANLLAPMTSAATWWSICRVAGRVSERRHRHSAHSGTHSLLGSVLFRIFVIYNLTCSLLVHHTEENTRTQRQSYPIKEVSLRLGWAKCIRGKYI